MIDLACCTVVSYHSETLVIHVQDEVLALQTICKQIILGQPSAQLAMTAKPMRPISALYGSVSEDTCERR